MDIPDQILLHIIQIIPPEGKWMVQAKGYQFEQVACWALVEHMDIKDGQITNTEVPFRTVVPMIAGDMGLHTVDEDIVYIYSPDQKFQLKEERELE